MAAPTLQEAKEVAIPMLVQGELSAFSPSDINKYTRQIAEATTIKEVEDALIGAGVPREAVTATFESEDMPLLAEAARREHAPIEQANFMDDPIRAVGDFFTQPFKGMQEKILYDFRNREGEDAVQRADLSAATQALVAAADEDVKQVIMDVLAANPDVKENWVQAAAAQRTEAEAFGVITQGMDDAEIAALDDSAIGFKNILTVNEGQESFRYLSRQAFIDRGIDIELHENHDAMISAGYSVYVEENVDGGYEMLYITPDDEQRAINAEDMDVGYYNPRAGDVVNMRATDSRAPIGMGTGTFLDSGRDVNEVAGRAEGTLKEFFNLYGFEYTDVVTDVDFETILRENVGLTKNQIDMFRTESERQELFEEFSEVDVQLHYQYLEGENVNMFINMPAEGFAGYQKRFEDVGVGYSAGEYGKFDPDFTRMVNTTMSYANINYEADPEGFEKSLADFENNRKLAGQWFKGGSQGGGTTRVWRPPAYLAPDYAELSQAVKTTFEAKLGRAPSGAEVTLLSNKMKADHRGEFDAQVEGQRLQFFGAGGNDAGTVQDVNYAARFQEDFENKYTDELGTLDRSEMSRNIMQQGLGSILAADRAIGY